MKTICLITCFCILNLIAVAAGLFVAKEFNNQNAMLNEYEYLLADAYQAQQECRDQLGVFYMEPE